MAGGDTNSQAGFDARFALVCRSFPLFVATCAVLGVFLVDFFPICDAARTFASRAGHVTTLELPGGVKMTLSEQAVSEKLSPFTADFETLKRDAAAAIARLEPEEFARLMQIGQLSDLCEYENPKTARMRSDVALDYALDEKGLAALSPNSLAVTMESGDSGRALKCYDLRLTGLGADVKTALVQSFKDAFAAPRERAQPASAGAKVAAR